MNAASATGHSADERTDMNGADAFTYDLIEIHAQLEANAQAVVTAHDTPIREASDPSLWERRGPLKRLVRRP
jgi:hypothetical protein